MVLNAPLWVRSRTLGRPDLKAPESRRDRINGSTSNGSASPVDSVLESKSVIRARRRGQTRRSPPRSTSSSPISTKAASPSSIVTMPSPSLQRSGLFAGFFDDIYYLSGISQRPLIMAEMQKWFLAPSGSMTELLLDALLLIQAAGYTGNSALRFEAQGKQTMALSRLNHTLGRQDLASKVDLLAATDVLSVCEMYTDLASSDDAWLTHFRGRGALAMGLPPSSLHVPALRDYIRTAILGSSWGVLFDRKPSPFATPQWLKAMEETCDGHMGCLNRIVCELGGLLERVDNAISVTPLADDERADLAATCQDLLAALTEAETRIVCWLTAWYTEKPGDVIRRRPMRDFAWFMLKVGALHDVFNDALEFPTFESYLGHLWYWDLRFTICKALGELCEHMGGLGSEAISQEQRLAVQSTLDEIADARCQATPSQIELCFEASRWMDVEASELDLGDVNAVVVWYGKRGAQRKLEFVEKVLVNRGCTGLGGYKVHRAMWKREGDGVNEVMLAEQYLVNRSLAWLVVGPSTCVCSGRTQARNGRIS